MHACPVQDLGPTLAMFSPSQPSMIVATSPHLSNAILIYNYSTQQVTLQACVGVRSGVRVQLRACGYAHVRQIVGEFPLVQIVTSLAISPDGFLLCVGTAGEATRTHARARAHSFLWRHAVMASKRRRLCCAPNRTVHSAADEALLCRPARQAGRCGRRHVPGLRGPSR